jgi:hypothetical protein
MAKYNIDQPGNRDIHSGRAATKVGTFKVAVETKSPACGTKPNKSKTKKVLTHELIAERARQIWQQRGCRAGEDERNWIEAETQLRAELDID